MPLWSQSLLPQLLPPFDPGSQKFTGNIEHALISPASAAAAGSSWPGCSGSWCAAGAPPGSSGLQKQGRQGGQQAWEEGSMTSKLMRNSIACHQVPSHSSGTMPATAASPVRLEIARWYLSAASLYCLAPCRRLPSAFSCSEAVRPYCCCALAWPTPALA